MAEVNLNSVRNILVALEENWFNSGDEVAIQCAHLLKSALKDQEDLTAAAAADDQKDGSKFAPTSPPSGLCLDSGDKSDQGLFQALYLSWSGLGWTVADHFKLAEGDKDRIKEARLMGLSGAPLKSDKIDIKISSVAPDTLVPRHSEEASEMIQILEGDHIQIGFAVDDWMERQKYNHFPPTHPKVVKTTDNHFVMVSVHFGKIDGKLWLNDEDLAIGDKYLGITEVQEQSVESYYDNVAKDYARAMRTWGYCMPELVTNAILQHAKLTPSADVKVIDLGCGDGAVGQTMHEKGFTNLTGTDISTGMMEIAEKRGVYNQLKKANLLQELPFEKESFDLGVSAGVTTYLDSSALKFWLPIIKKDGILCIVHKESVWPKWVDEQERLESCKAWKMTWFSQEPVPYLPSLDCKGTDKARIYIYQKL